LRLANELKIKGEVKNSGGNVTIIAQGTKEALDTLIQRLIAVFKIKYYNTQEIKDKNYTDFKIVHSNNDNDIPFITPDLATCADCEKELKDENNRRYHHPFISCVNCGPRYTIINSLPYDRERIVMNKFNMCDKCSNEYINPFDRRCHAQTIACNECGPATNISIDSAVKILQQDKILAIKDIGGYHLACKCNTDTALKLRELKGRETKPFAIMFSSTDEIKKYCKVSDKEEELLTSPARPIVLLEKIKDFPSGICDSSDYIGAFLPCNPIQIMILDRISPLIMTSANYSGEPIITNDKEIKKFNVDILSHNREILTPIDDSIVQINSGRTQFIRRARGYVPLAIDIGIKSDKKLLCMGGDLKSSFCIVNQGYAYPSQYFGDLEDVDYFNSYKENISRFCNLHSFTPDIKVCDKHPLYYSSNMFDCDIKVQHHLAHAYSVIAEHHLKGDVLSFVFDGTGYGDDSAIWGSEVFLNTKRVEHLQYTKMIASDEISKNPDLALACYDKSNELINKAIENNINTVNSSSMGRLFDAVCSALDIKHYNTYEGECAQALESVAKTASKPFYIEPTLNPIQIIKAVKSATAPKNEVALGFHICLSELILNIAKKYNVKQITLSGGCFVNRLLMSNTIKLLEENNFDVYTNEQVSSGDNGICLGQAYLAIMEE
jgi:hydrogenase maturation protein HypF